MKRMKQRSTEFSLLININKSDGGQDALNETQPAIELVEGVFHHIADGLVAQSSERFWLAAHGHPGQCVGIFRYFLNVAIKQSG